MISIENQKYKFYWSHRYSRTTIMIERIRKILDIIEKVGIARFLFILSLGASLGAAATGLYVTKFDPNIKIADLDQKVSEMTNVGKIRSQQIIELSVKIEDLININKSLRTENERIIKENKDEKRLPESPQPTLRDLPSEGLDVGKKTVVPSAAERKTPGPRARATELAKATALRFGKPMWLFGGDVRFMVQDYRDANAFKEIFSPDKCKFIFGDEDNPDGYYILEKNKPESIWLYERKYSVNLSEKSNNVCYLEYTPNR